MNSTIEDDLFYLAQTANSDRDWVSLVEELVDFAIKRVLESVLYYQVVKQSKDYYDPQ